MTQSKLSRTIAVLAVSLTTTAFSIAQTPGRQDDGDGPPARQFAGPEDLNRRMLSDNQMSRAVAVLGELNLSPDFNLSEEQKQSIATIRDAFKKQQEQWQTAHADDLKNMNDAMAEAMNAGGPPDPSAMRTIFEERRKIMSSAPTGTAEANQMRPADSQSGKRNGREA